MPPDRLQQARDAAVAAAVAAGRKLKAGWGRIDWQTKGLAGEMVTQLDRETELFLAEQLDRFDPAIGFRGEEFGVRRQADPTWLVDPVDGTVHFIRGLPFCTTMICLIEAGRPVVAVIHDFTRDETYSAVRGQGADCNGRPIRVSGNSTKTGSLIMTEMNLKNPLARQLRSDPRLVGQPRVNYLLRTANSGWEFAMVASGRIDGRLVFDGFGHDYDYAPGCLLVAEAGGVVTNLGLKDYDYTKLDLLAANPVVHRELTTGPGALFPVGAGYRPLGDREA